MIFGYFSSLIAQGLKKEPDLEVQLVTQLLLEYASGAPVALLLVGIAPLRVTDTAHVGVLGVPVVGASVLERVTHGQVLSLGFR